MREKYLVKIYDDNENLMREERYKTKNEIKEKYSIEKYMINKIIKLFENKLITKRKSHLIFQDTIKKFKISLIKPVLTIQNPDDIEPVKKTKKAKKITHIFVN